MLNLAAHKLSCFSLTGNKHPTHSFSISRGKRVESAPTLGLWERLGKRWVLSWLTPRTERELYTSDARGPTEKNQELRNFEQCRGPEGSRQMPEGEKIVNSWKRRWPASVTGKSHVQTERKLVIRKDLRDPQNLQPGLLVKVSPTLS